MFEKSELCNLKVGIPAIALVSLNNYNFMLYLLKA